VVVLFRRGNWPVFRVRSSIVRREVKLTVMIDQARRIQSSHPTRPSKFLLISSSAKNTPPIRKQVENLHRD
jgi:hypothetical protein